MYSGVSAADREYLFIRFAPVGDANKKMNILSPNPIPFVCFVFENQHIPLTYQ